MGLTKSGIPVSTDTVQAVTQAELETDSVKDQMKQWKEGTARVLEAKSEVIVNPEEGEVNPQMLFDLETEDKEFLRGFDLPITVENLDDDGSQEPEEEQEKDEQVIGDAPDAPTYVGMEIGLRREAEGELHRAKVKRRAIGQDDRPIGIASNNPMVDSRLYEVEYDDGTTEVLAANLLAENILEQVDEWGHKHRLMEEIGGHRKGTDALSQDDAFMILDNGSKRRRRTTKGWEMYVIWKDGSSNWLTLKAMKEAFPIETAMYAMEHKLTEEPAFAWWVQHVLRKKDRCLKKVKSKYWERTHKYGIRVPKNIAEAKKIDEENKNTLWQDAIKLEMKNNRVAFEEYTGDLKKLVGYKKITGHLVFDIKLGENFRRKARFVADGHRTAPPQSMTYSTVVSRDSVRILLMIAALNELDLQAADIQNAFLTAPNLERCYMIAGPEFLDEQDKVFIVKRALYGLKSAPNAFRTFLAQNIEDLGFFSSEADPDVYLRAAVKPDGEEYYEYILCYVDDILCISAKAKEVMQQLQKKFKFKKDIIAPPENYLGARVKQKTIDGHSMWTISSVDYVKAAVKNVEEALEKKKWAKLPTAHLGNTNVSRICTRIGRFSRIGRRRSELLSRTDRCTKMGH